MTYQDVTFIGTIDEVAYDMNHQVTRLDIMVADDRRAIEFRVRLFGNNEEDHHYEEGMPVSVNQARLIAGNNGWPNEAEKHYLNVYRGYVRPLPVGSVDHFQMVTLVGKIIEIWRGETSSSLLIETTQRRAGKPRLVYFSVRMNKTLSRHVYVTEGQQILTNGLLLCENKTGGPREVGGRLQYLLRAQQVIPMLGT